MHVYAGGRPKDRWRHPKQRAVVLGSLDLEGESLAEDGEYTAIAEQPSSLKNQPGKANR